MELNSQRDHIFIEQALARLEMLEGLCRAFDNWEEVSSRVSQSEDLGEAIATLRQPPLCLTEIQARTVLDSRQSRRTVQERRKIEQELDAVRAKVSEQPQ